MKLTGVCGKISILVVLAMLLLVAFGCSGTGTQPVTQPEQEPVLSADMSEGHTLFGAYNIAVDTVNMTAVAIEDRTAYAHYNVAPFILSTCPTCLTVAVTGVNPDERIFTLQISLKNPTFHVGYDVKGIIKLDGTGEYDLRNPDVYTGLYSGGFISPFIYYAKSATNYQFPPAATYAAEFQVYISASHTPTFNIPFAIDASFPGIQEDPIWIQNIAVLNNGANVTIDCDVIDNQTNVERVYADTTAFTGGTTDLALISGNHYRATFPVGSAPGGLNRVLLSAKSVGSTVLLHHYANVFVNAAGATLQGRVFNAITTQNALNTKIIVTNTVGGFAPLPTVIGENGLYYYIMQPGDYNAQVLTNTSVIQYDKMVTNYPIHIEDGDHVAVNWGMGPSYLNDTTEQICCINGQVFDNATGDPLAFAQISISGGAQTGGTFQSRITDSLGNYVFWKVPCKDGSGQLISNFEITCVRDGYIPAQRTAVPFAWNQNTPQENFYLTSIGGQCVWDETFEGGGDPAWQFQMISGVSMFHMHQDSALFNDNVTAQAYDGGPIVELPPDDTTQGRVWQPWEGTWGMWYGEEDDGSFIHIRADQSPGGTSTFAHSGRATSPIIDLTANNKATLTWQQVWEIEGVDPSIQYDFLRVYIRDAAGGSWFLFEHSNPTTEPVPDLGGGNAKHPQTSAGFNIAPIWQAIVSNLGDLDNPDTGPVEHMNFTQKQIQLKFEFGTVDSLYNGFRGWLIDDMCVFPGSIG